MARVGRAESPTTLDVSQAFVGRYYGQSKGLLRTHKLGWGLGVYHHLGYVALSQLLVARPSLQPYALQPDLHTPSIGHTANTPNESNQNDQPTRASSTRRRIAGSAKRDSQAADWRGWAR